MFMRMTSIDEVVLLNSNSRSFRCKLSRIWLFDVTTTCPCVTAQHERMGDIVLPFNDRRLQLIYILCDEAKLSISQDHTRAIDFFHQVTSAVASFTMQNIEPPLRVIRTLLFDILLKAPSASSVYETYHYLLFMFILGMCHPSSFHDFQPKPTRRQRAQMRQTKIFAL